MTSFSPWLASHLDTILLWAGALCTLGLFSILYKENRVYRFFEHLFLGLATGYMVATIWNDTLLPKWWKPMWDKGEWWQLFWLLFGLFYYLIYSKKLNWIARLIIGFFLGVASGRSFQAFANDYWPQIPTSFKPLLPHGVYKYTLDGAEKTAKAVTWPDALNNWVFLIILLCVMSYFFFSIEQNNVVLKNSAKWGRWLMMFTFGAIFGSTIMGRLALLIDRIDFLLNDFGSGLMPGSGNYLMFAFLLAMAGIILYLITRPGANSEEI